jgi:hypothetical protein
VGHADEQSMYSLMSMVFIDIFQRLTSAMIKASSRSSVAGLSSTGTNAIKSLWPFTQILGSIFGRDYANFGVNDALKSFITSVSQTVRLDCRSLRQEHQVTIEINFLTSVT